MLALDRLVAKSLLVRQAHANKPTRLGMLETIREYATERFAATADTQAVRERHYRYFLALAQRHGSDRALWGTGRAQHLARLDAEIANLHLALTWAIDRLGAEPALALCATLGQYWLTRDRYADAVDWIERTLHLPGADAHPALRVRALYIKASALWALGRVGEQPAAMAEAEATARALADPLILSEVLVIRATQEAAEGRRGAETVAAEALRWASEAGDRWAIAMAAQARAVAADSAANFASASTGPPHCCTRSETSTYSRTCLPPPPTGRCVTAAIATQRRLSTARFRSRATLTIRSSGCFSEGISVWSRC